MTSTTPKLRWRKVAPENLRGAPKAYVTGDAPHGLDGLVRIEYLGRGENGGWHALIRENPDANFGDGWWWSSVLVPERPGVDDGYMTPLLGATEADMKAAVAEWWHRIAPYALSTIESCVGDQAAPASAEDAAGVERDRQASEPAPGSVEALQAAAAGAADDVTARVTDSVAGFLSENYVELVAGVADRLRRAADRIERLGVPSSSIRDLLPDHTRAASHVLDEITGTVANLGLSHLVQTARDADNAARGQV